MPIKKLAALVFLLISLVAANYLLSNPLRLQTSADENSQISFVAINPGQIITSPNSEPVALSALAYDANNQPIWTNVFYEWGISSGGIGHLIPNTNLATFIPQTAGFGDLWVTATNAFGSTTKSIPIAVGECVRHTPSFTFLPPNQSGLAGSSLDYTYTLTNNDNQFCPPAIISSFGSHNLPSGWSYSFNPQNLTVYPGQTGFVTATYTSKIGALPGFYYVYIDPITATPGYSSAYTYAKYTVVTSLPTPEPTVTPTPYPTNIPLPTLTPIVVTLTPYPTITTLPTRTPIPTITPPPQTTTIDIYAAGSPSIGIYPKMELRINDTTVARWKNIRGNPSNHTYLKYTYQHPSPIYPTDIIRVAFTNNFKLPRLGDRNLRIDRVVIDGITYQSEDPQTYGKGAKNSQNKCGSGYFQTEWLYCNGYFQYFH